MKMCKTCAVAIHGALILISLDGVVLLVLEILHAVDLLWLFKVYNQLYFENQCNLLALVHHCHAEQPLRGGCAAGSFRARTHEVLNFSRAMKSQRNSVFHSLFHSKFIQSFCFCISVKAFLGFPAHGFAG